MEFVAVVVGGHDVQQQDVLGLQVQPGNAELHLGEHLPESENDTQPNAPSDPKWAPWN